MKLKINSKNIGPGNPCFIVAEMSANHNQRLDLAIETIKAAKSAGADAIKLQTYTPDTLTINSEKDWFTIQFDSPWDGRTLYDVYKEAFTPWEWHEELFRIANDEGLICFSSPFDLSAIDLLETLNCPAYKIASPEILDVNLIAAVAATGKPVIISTGIATESDVEMAVETCRQQGNNQIVLLQCTTAYPASIEVANLCTIPYLAETFQVAAGLSDHTLGIEVPMAAVALGASMIEKHFIIDRSLGGPDASFSLDKNEFVEMVKAIRKVEKALGSVHFSDRQSTEHDFGLAGRSLFVVQDVQASDMVTEENVRSIRPGYGLHPRYLNGIFGKHFVSNLAKGTPLRLEHLRD